MDILHFLVLNYSFNLFYLFILVMRNNIMIVDPSFFLVLTSVFNYKVFMNSFTKLIHNYKQYMLFSSSYVFIFNCKGE